MKRQSQKPTADSSDDDSDVEKNFALLTKRGGASEQVEKQESEGEESEEEGEEAEEESGEEGEESEEEEEESGEEGEESEEEEEESGEELEEEGEKKQESEGEESEDSEADGDSGSSEGAEPEEPTPSSGLQSSEDIKKELSHMSFEDILKLQRQVGTKAYNQVASGGGSSGQKGESKSKRLNKNRPMEISAKKPPPLVRQVVDVKKRTFRDPRFDDLSGEYKPEIFEKTYKFIDNIRQTERATVQKKLRKLKKNSQRREELEFLLKRMDEQERARTMREQQRERELKLKREQRERANLGTRPFFLKKSEKKKLQLAERYEELKKSGKLDNFLSKKRKRNALKDRRRMPAAPQRGGRGPGWRGGRGGGRGRGQDR